MNIFDEIRDKKDFYLLDKEFDKISKIIEKKRNLWYRESKKLSEIKNHKKHEKAFKKFEKKRKKANKKLDKEQRKFDKRSEKIDKRWANENDRSNKEIDDSFRTITSFRKLQFILPYIKSISPDSFPKSVSRLDSLLEKNDYETLEELVDWCNETLKKSPNIIYEEDPIMEIMKSESPDLYNEINDWISTCEDFKSLLR